MSGYDRREVNFTSPKPQANEKSGPDQVAMVARGVENRFGQTRGRDRKWQVRVFIGRERREVEILEGLLNGRRARLGRPNVPYEPRPRVKDGGGVVGPVSRLEQSFPHLCVSQGPARVFTGFCSSISKGQDREVVFRYDQATKDRHAETGGEWTSDKLLMKISFAGARPPSFWS